MEGRGVGLGSNNWHLRILWDELLSEFVDISDQVGIRTHVVFSDHVVLELVLTFICK
jgi:hypothetical protein